MTDDKNSSKELRDLGTQQAGAVDQHETRHAGKPVIIEPGRAPGSVSGKGRQSV
jgi:hypothetical protein